MGGCIYAYELDGVVLREFSMIVTPLLSSKLPFFKRIKKKKKVLESFETLLNCIKKKKEKEEESAGKFETLLKSVSNNRVI